MLRRFLKIWLISSLIVVVLGFVLFLSINAPASRPKPPLPDVAHAPASPVTATTTPPRGITGLPEGERQVATHDLDILRGLTYVGTMDGILTDKGNVFIKTKHQRFELIDQKFWMQHYPNSELTMTDFGSEEAFASLAQHDRSDPRIALAIALCDAKISVVIYERVAMTSIADEDAHANGEKQITNACQFVTKENPIRMNKPHHQKYSDSE